jgi:signal peptidase I
MDKIVDIQSDPGVLQPAPDISAVKPEHTPGVLLRIFNRELLYDVIETIILAVVIWFAVNLTTARFIVEGSSMEPTLHTGQYLLIDRLGYQFGEPRHGDIVVFHYPINPVDDYVKRVIGVPGDEVRIQSSSVFVNGQVISEPYIVSDGMFLGEGYAGKWEIPDGRYFVMGDNRSHSSDSRSWGLLDRANIIGKAWLSYWPPQSSGIMQHFDFTSP